MYYYYYYYGRPRLKARLTSKRCGQVRSQQSSDARNRFSPSPFSLPFLDEVHQDPESHSWQRQTALTCADRPLVKLSDAKVSCRKGNVTNGEIHKWNVKNVYPLFIEWLSRHLRRVNR
jgi:hypothetical protein